jgi:hypothetical protein
MNWTKPNFTQWVTIITLIGSVIGYLWHIESNRVEAQIAQHDQEQRIDSIATAFAIFVNEFKDLRKNREIVLKQREEEKEQNDIRLDEIGTRLTIMETEFHDYLKYKK